MTVTSCDELGSEGDLCLQLQADLVFMPLHQRATGWSYRVDDPARSQFFRVGVEEYAIISLLDGHTTLREAWQELRASEMAPNLTQRDCVTIARWLLSSGLAVPVQDGRVLSTNAEQDRPGGDRQYNWNPLFFRIPLIRPDSLVASLLPWTGWIHSRVMLLAWCLTLLTAAFQVAGQWARFSADSIGILAADNWLWLLGTVAILKVLHEFSHAVACRQYGGRVGAAGVMLVFFAPLAWIDVTSSWRFRSRWKRIHVALAGIYLESWIAAAAALWWCRTEPGVLSFHLYNIMLVGGVSSLVFNANPLMRADGYYVLSDLAEIPNLMSSAMQQMLGTARWVLLGTAPPASAYSGWRRVLILGYGPASCCWRLFVYTCLILGAGVLLNGTGIVLAAAGVAAVLIRPLKLFAVDVVGGFRKDESRVRRFLLAGSIGSFCILLPMFGIDWRQHYSAPGVIQFAPHTPVRARAAGFLAEVRVNLNQQLRQGDVLAILRNDELQTELTRLRFDVEASQIKCRLLQRQNRIAEYRIEQDNLAGLQKQMHEKEEQVASLVIRAPHMGIATGQDLRSLAGAYFDEGDELLSVSGSTGREMRASIPQEYAESIASLNGAKVHVRIPGRNTLAGSLAQMTPRGTKQLGMLRLSAGFGGPVEVSAADSAASSGQQHAHELFAPRFDATIKITEATRDLRAGETGVVSWLGRRRSAGQRLADGIRRWIRDRTSANVAPGE